MWIIILAAIGALILKNKLTSQGTGASFTGISSTATSTVYGPPQDPPASMTTQRQAARASVSFNSKRHSKV